MQQVHMVKTAATNEGGPELEVRPFLFLASIDVRNYLKRVEYNMFLQEAEEKNVVVVELARWACSLSPTFNSSAQN